VPSAETLALMAAVALALGLTPGPDMLFCFASGMERGPRGGLAASGGILLGLAAHIAAAILGVSASLATDERTAAHDVARFIGVPLVEIETYEADRPEYRANGADRCFHCKDELFSRIGDDVAATHRLDAIAYGENADDARRPDRPGAEAATNHRVLRPLSDAGLDKAGVRRLARAWSLPSADKPAAPCLASRIPHNSEVTPEKLAQIDAAEAALRALGFEDLRVRHHGDIARIELPAEDLVRAAGEPLRRQVRQAVVGAGFRYAALDLGGMQSGDFTLTVLRRDPAVHG